MITARQISDYRATANSILADDCDPELMAAAGMILTLCHAIDAMRADAELGALVRRMPLNIALSHRAEGFSVTAFQPDTPLYVLHGTSTRWCVEGVLFNGTADTPEAVIKAAQP